MAEEGALAEIFRASREEADRAIVAEAERIRRKAEMGGSWGAAGAVASWDGSPGQSAAATTSGPR